MKTLLLFLWAVSVRASFLSLFQARKAVMAVDNPFPVPV